MPSSWVCIDAGIVVRLVTGGDGSERIATLWDEWRSSGRQVAAPRLLAYEVTNVLWRHAVGGILDPAEARAALDVALGLGIRWHDGTWLHQAAYEAAHRYALTAAYDAHYIALSEGLDADLWTTDQRLIRGVRGARLRPLDA